MTTPSRISTPGQHQRKIARSHAEGGAQFEPERLDARRTVPSSDEQRAAEAVGRIDVRNS